MGELTADKLADPLVSLGPHTLELARLQSVDDGDTYETKLADIHLVVLSVEHTAEVADQVAFSVSGRTITFHVTAATTLDALNVAIYGSLP